MRDRTSRLRDGDNALWEDQCEQLRQQLSSSTSLSTSLLRNQQTLLSMLQNQTASLNAVGAPGTVSFIFLLHCYQIFITKQIFPFYKTA